MVKKVGRAERRWTDLERGKRKGAVQALLRITTYIFYEVTLR
jgi:hypothetical protein